MCAKKKPGATALEGVRAIIWDVTKACPDEKRTGVVEKPAVE